ncbi:MAG: hypothetical protein LBQ39_02005 [Tannerellaceae bacterium]|jgi:hypothetical protein|nr:hypothetical protein [Tannerellaceae bacterium]
MARTPNTTVTTTVLLNGKQAESGIKTIQEKLDALTKAKEEFNKQGLFADNSEEVSTLEKERADLEKILKQLKSSSKDVSDVITNIGGATQAQLEGARNVLVKINKSIVAETPEWNKNSEIIKQLNERIDELKGKSKGAEDGIERFTDKLKKFSLVAAGLYIAKKVAEWLGDLASKAKDFVVEGIKMAATAEGVSKAFGKLDADSKGLLSNLRGETKGLIDDFQLMQSAVKAKNFNIPLNELGTLLKFAQQRAQETGQSVDYLVDSIINGVGRKSPLILDNLGISASRLQEQVKKTGDFASAVIEIVNEGLKKQGDLALTSADKATQAAVKWDNAQLKIGQRFKWLGDLWNKISGNVADAVGKFAGETRDANEIFDDQWEKVTSLEVETRKLAERYDELKKQTSLSKDEQTELNKIMLKLSNLSIPGVISRSEEYGEILSVNTGLIYDYIDAEKAKLQVLNASAIAQRTEELIKYREELKKLELEEKTGVTWVQETLTPFGPGTAFPKRIEEDEMDVKKKRIAELVGYVDKNGKKIYGLIQGTEAILDDLQGKTMDEFTNLYKEKEAQTEAFNKMNKEQLDTWINDEQNALNKYLALAKRIYEKNFGTDDVDPNKDKHEAERLQASLDAIDAYVDAERTALMKARVNREAYRGEMIDSETKYNDMLEKIQFEALQKTLDITGLSKEDKIEAERKVWEFKLGLFKKEESETEKFQKELDDLFEKFDLKGVDRKDRELLRLKQEYDDGTALIMKAIEKRKDKQKEYYEFLKILYERYIKEVERINKEANANEDLDYLGKSEGQERYDTGEKFLNGLINYDQYLNELTVMEMQYAETRLNIAGMNEEQLTRLRIDYQNLRLKHMQKAVDKQKKIEDEFEDMMKSSLAGIGEAFVAMFSASEDAGEAFGEAMVDLVFDILMRLVDIWVMQMQAKAAAATFEAAGTEIGEKGVAGIATAAVAAAAIQAALQVAKAAIKSAIGKGGSVEKGQRVVKTEGFAAGGYVADGSGGYTGRGGVYQPAGYVHKGEYVTPQWQMRDPISFRYVQALDAIRQSKTFTNPLPRYGGYAEGGPTDAPIAPAPTDPRLIAVLEGVETLLIRMKDGVPAYLNYSLLENMRDRVEKSRNRGTRKK